ncbi:beta-galactosidase [Cribrihabitans neustonicus]|uniref:beta-galactosidase n=1 Tax=Cribrihabitans neustonicus TaxID=1429085 RepID=UPI003B5C6F54
MKRTLGTCYYPEHWPRRIWEEDARRMAEAGITWVRIGEFAWSRLEPQPGAYDFTWLDEAIAVLGQAGLKVVLGTPTATPPRWMLDRHPDMLAVDAGGRPRKFGSRRHYCFSHEGYKAECARIVTLLAERYGTNPHIAAWQTDNEYGCHDTVISYSDSAAQAFQKWLAARYPAQGNKSGIEALNEAWGNVFWSMDYDDFGQIGLPNLTVTEPNPSHVLDFRRFSSDQVVAFNRLQAEIIRAHSAAPIAHNYMGRITEFDHYKVGDDLDIASWDSYPLGFLEDRIKSDAAHQRAYARQGDPDFQAFHHDLYRAVGRGRWWVMEQQPGPVNWAPHNPAPLPGMVRLWSWEAFAHGAEAVCYFRWRQAPMAQEQMHAGLLRPDSVAAPGLAEAMEVARELADAPEVAPVQAEVALIFDYEADWAWSIQPHGTGLSYFDLVFETYRAMRKLGWSVDILRPDAALSGYKLIAAPGLMHMSDALKQRLQKSDALCLLGPRSGARDATMRTPVPLPPALPGWNLTVTHVESLRPDMPMPLKGGGAVTGYREAVEGEFEVIEALEDGSPAVVADGRRIYLCGWLDQEALAAVLRHAAKRAGVECLDLPEGVRVRRTGAECFWFNYSAETREAAGRCLPPVSVSRTAL